RFPQVFYRRDPADTQVDLESSDLDYLASGRMFITNGTSLCASPSRESTYLALELAHNAGVPVVLDVDYRSMSWRKPEESDLAWRVSLPFVDVLIGNDVELKLVAAAADLPSASDRLRSVNIAMLVSKLGEQGTRVYEGDSEIYCAPYQ